MEAIYGTGWASSVDPGMGWFVGYVERERDGNVYFLATNVESESSVESLGWISRQITMEILREIGIVK